MEREITGGSLCMWLLLTGFLQFSLFSFAFKHALLSYVKVKIFLCGLKMFEIRMNNRIRI